MRVFLEKQKFTQAWLWLLMAVSMIAPLVIIIKEYSKENSDITFSTLLLIIAGFLLPIGLILSFTLITRIDEKGIHYQFKPFYIKFKTIEWKELKEAFVREYDPISEYGGWGLKGGFFRSKGKAVNVSGTTGLQLIFKNNKKLLIGTQKGNEVNQTLNYYKHKFEQNEQ